MDYKNLKKPGEKSKPNYTPANQDVRWWEAEGAQCAQRVWAALDTLNKAQSNRIRQLVSNARIYGNAGVFGAMGADASALSRLTSSSPIAARQATTPEVAGCIDTLDSRVGEEKPKPYFLTKGGDYRQQRKAERLTDFVEGVFYEEDVFAQPVFRDSAVFGDGLLHVYVDVAGRVRVERVLPTEIWVDEEECLYGEPRTLYRHKLADREVVASSWPKLKEEVMRAPPARDMGRMRPSTSDLVSVVECWRLGTLHEDGSLKGGKWGVCLAAETGGVMLEEPQEWPHEFFPFQRLQWCRRSVGYWSQSAVEQVQGDQMELNKLDYMLQRSFHLVGSPFWLLPVGAQIVKEHLSNEIGRGIMFAGGVEPKLVAPEPIHQAFFGYRESVVQRIRDRLGLTTMETTGKVDPGVQQMSGKALRERQVIQSARHAAIQAANTRFYIGLAKKIVALANEAAALGKLKPVRKPEGGEFATIDWKRDVKDVKTDEFVLECWPVSSLDGSPSEQLQTIEEFVQAGAFDMEEGFDLLGFPDMQRARGMKNAQRDLIRRNLDAIIDGEEYEMPEPTDDLALSHKLCIEYIQRYRLRGLEDEKLQLLQNYLAQVVGLTQQAQAQAAPPPGAAPGGPPAVPAPPPVSQLLPNAPGAQA